MSLAGRIEKLERQQPPTPEYWCIVSADVPDDEVERQIKAHVPEGANLLIIRSNIPRPYLEPPVIIYPLRSFRHSQP